MSTATDTGTDDDTSTDSTEVAADTTQTGQSDTDGTGSTETDDDAAKWKALARKHEQQAKANAEAARRLKEIEDAQKSETEKLTEALDAARSDATTTKTELARLKAAVKHGLSEDDLDLLGTGTPEEIEERAKRLSDRLAGTPVVPASRNLGGGPDPVEETDPRKLAATLPRY
jgi:hypothetical protein